jgi:hypothetical protein
MNIYCKDNMKLSMCGIILSAYCLLGFAQAPDTLWTRTFGSTEYDLGYCVQQTTDGGYIIVGETCSYGAGGADIYIIKTFSDGRQHWSKTAGGTGDDIGVCIQQITDGYIIVGHTNSFGAGVWDVYLVRIELDGTVLWSRAYGWIGSDYGHSVQQTSDEGYIIVGTTDSGGHGGDDIWLIKTDEVGRQVWGRFIGGADVDRGYSVKQVSDGGYIVVGCTKSYGSGNFDVWLVKTDSLGVPSWDRTFGGGYLDVGCSIQQAADGGYIIAGHTLSFGPGNGDVFFIKTDDDGQYEWSNAYGVAAYSEEAYAVVQTVDGGYLAVGHTTANQNDVYLVKTDDSGNGVWTKTVGGSDMDHGKSVIQTSDGGFVVVGYTLSYGAGGQDVYLIKLASDESIKETEIRSVKDCKLSATIINGPLRLPKDKKCKILDIAGREVDRRHLAPGIYFLEIDGQVIHKVVKIK